MDLIISLLVLGAMYSISYVMRSLSPKDDGQDGKTIFGEGFPTIEIFGPEQETVAEPESELEPQPQLQSSMLPVQPAVASAEKRPAATKQQRLNVDRSPQTHAPVQNVTVSNPRKRLVALGSKSEAKRAFIYSEIFNRKY